MTREHALPVPFELQLDTAALRRSGQLEGVVADLYQQMRVPVTGYAFQVVGSRQEAEDLVQLAFLRLWDALQQDQPIRNIRSWIYRVVHNLAIDATRRASVEQAHERREAQRQVRSAQSSAEADVIARQAIEQALASLSERERHALMLRAEGLRYQEIADVLGTSASAVSVYLVRGLKKFGRKAGQRS